MRLLIFLLLMAAACSAADRKNTVLPAGAVAIGPHTYRYIDAAGKEWIYRQTPFGLTRIEHKPASDGKAEPGRKLEDLITAVEDGEYVRFERAGAFGRYRWKRKKSELDELEQAVWKREKAKKTAPPAGNAKE